MTQTFELPLKRCTPESFSPYGQMMGLPAQGNTLQWAATKTWSADFFIDGKTELMFARFDPMPLKDFGKTEAHFAVTQTFIVLGDTPYVTAFARPTAPGVVPEPSEYEALLIPGNSGVMMHRGVWHSSRFLIRPGTADFIILTDAHTTVELVAMNDKGRGRLTHVVEYGKERGQAFRVVDPDGLLKTV